jgi:hypothetical protein
MTSVPFLAGAQQLFQGAEPLFKRLHLGSLFLQLLNLRLLKSMALTAS